MRNRGSIERQWHNRVFAALADPLAREAVEAIRTTPGITVSDLCSLFPVSRFTIMRHLNALEEAELLYRERSGQSKQLFINAATFKALSTGWLAEIGSAEPRKGPTP